ncbi:MAG: hypothetical protein EOO59_20130, partial [Hymenobacter sp.]
MTDRYRLRHALAGLLGLVVAMLLGFGARAQQTPGARPEAGPPTSRRCRYLRLAPGRDTTSFAIADSLTVVPGSVTVQGQSVGYDARADRYRWVQPARRDSSGNAQADSVLLCYRVLPLALLRTR